MNKDKELLFQDLCARLAYGVICQFEDTIRVIDGKSDPFYDYILSGTHLDLYINHTNFHIKPYLRSMSSMTEEERMEFAKLFDKWHDDELFDYIEEGAEFSIWKHKGISPVIFDWLNRKMFDYRGLIPMDLALEAPKDMYDF